MKNTFKFLACVMAILMIFTSIPAVSFSAFAQEFKGVSSKETLPWDVVLNEDEDITRAQWIHNLVVVFGIEQEEYLLPDNYYADIDETHEYYNDFLLAVDYGFIDLEEGEMLYPDDIATRDFAVSTLNFGLGYQLGESTEFSFSDANDCFDPVSAQIAINRGWIKTVNNAFIPNKKLTYDEALFMLNDAYSTLMVDEINPDYDSSYAFLDNVKVVDSSVLATKDESGLIHIVDCPIEINSGDKFAVYFNGIPNVYSAETIEVIDNETVITCVSTESEDAFSGVDAEGVLGFESFEFIPEDNVHLEIVDDISAASAFDTAKLKNINVTVPLSMGGVDVNVDVTIKNPKIEYYVKSDKVKVALSGDYDVEYSAEVNMLEAGGMEKSIPLFACNVLGLGTFKISVDVDFKAKAGGMVKGTFVAGFECEKDKDVRAIKHITKKDAYSEYEGSTKIALKASLSTTDLPLVSASIYASVGYKSSVNMKVYSDNNKPHVCEHRKAYIFADYGLSLSMKIGVWKEKENFSTDIFNEFNSPVRTVEHYEDDKLVGECTRGGLYSKYFSKYNSRWLSSRNGYGLAADGSYVSLFEYDVNDSDQLVITGYNGNSGYINIPEEIDGKKVVAIGNNAFRELDIVSVTIPDTVTEIGWAAFANCPNLKTVKLSNSLKVIDAYAFESCYSLSKITLPDSLNELYTGSFADCISLQKINIPKSLTKVSYSGYYSGPFDGCLNLTQVEFAKNVTDIPNGLFYRTGLKEIVIPNSVTKIGSSAFANCESLAKVTFSDSLDVIGNFAFENCISLTSVELPPILTVTEGAVFYNCTGLTDAFVPKSLTNANKGFCYSAYGLFAGCSSLNNVVLEEGVKVIPDFIFRGCDGITEIVLADSIEEIEANAFADCTSLKSITLPSKIDRINQYTFGNCASLEEIIIPESVKSIGANAFENCTALNKVEISEGLEEIWEYAFYGCSALKEISIPDSVSLMYYAVFINCTSLEKVKLPVNLDVIPNFTFENCSALKEFTIQKSIEEIEVEAFSKCTGLEVLHFEEGSKLKYINSKAFADCENLKELVIPDGVQKIENAAFSGCKALSKIYIPSSVKEIKENAFENCVALEDVTLEDYGLTKISCYTFDGCPSLKRIVLPKGLREIDEYAFKNNTALVDVEIPESVTFIDENAFSYPLRTTIYSKADSYVYEFANEFGFNFVDNYIACEGLCLKDEEEYVEVIVGDVFVPEFEFYPEESNSVITLTADSDIVEIKGHHIFANSPGLTVITAETSDGAYYEFTLYVKGVERLEVTSYPNKLSYNLGEELDLDGIVVEAFYDDGTSFAVEEYEVYGFDSSYEGVCTICIVYYTKAGTAFDVYLDLEIIDSSAKVTDFYITSLPNKLNYERKESLDLTGFVVKADYSDGTTAEITDYKVSGFNPLKSGVQTVTVTFEEKTVTFEVLVGITVASVEIAEMPYTTEYYKGEEFCPDGLVLLITYSNGTTSEVYDGFTFNGFNPEKTGEQIITVTYLGTSATFSVNVIGFDEEFEKGDVNGDGDVNVTDLAMLKKLIAGLMSVEDDSVKQPDVNEDGGVNASDLALLKKMIAKLA